MPLTIRYEHDVLSHLDIHLPWVVLSDRLHTIQISAKLFAFDISFYAIVSKILIPFVVHTNNQSLFVLNSMAWIQCAEYLFIYLVVTLHLG